MSFRLPDKFKDYFSHYGLRKRLGNGWRCMKDSVFMTQKNRRRQVVFLCLWCPRLFEVFTKTQFSSLFVYHNLSKKDSIMFFNKVRELKCGTYCSHIFRVVVLALNMITKTLSAELSFGIKTFIELSLYR